MQILVAMNYHHRSMEMRRTIRRGAAQGQQHQLGKRHTEKKIANKQKQSNHFTNKLAFKHLRSHTQIGRQRVIDTFQALRREKTTH